VVLALGIGANAAMFTVLNGRTVRSSGRWLTADPASWCG
jgi:hypothetical protein